MINEYGNYPAPANGLLARHRNLKGYGHCFEISKRVSDGDSIKPFDGHVFSR